MGCGVPSAPRVPGAAQGGWVSEEGKAPGHRGPLRPVWSAEAGPPARVGQGQVWTCSGHELWPSCSPEHFPSCSSAGLTTGPGQTGTARPSATTESSSGALASPPLGRAHLLEMRLRVPTGANTQVDLLDLRGAGAWSPSGRARMSMGWSGSPTSPAGSAVGLNRLPRDLPCWFPLLPWNSRPVGYCACLSLDSGPHLWPHS